MDANVGVNRQLVVEPTIKNARGYRDQVEDIETLQDINFKLYNTEMNFVDFFKQQAKEVLENE